MAYNLNLAEKIRNRLIDISPIEEKEMMGGLAFMYNGKMCVGIIKDEMMCRIDPQLFDWALEQNACREMDFTGRPMKGWVMIEEAGINHPHEFNQWIQMALEFNKKAKKTLKKKKNNSV
jgi:TfoX/Sxy family transcriptional regulator of competence genes